MIFKYKILESAEGFREENYSATRVNKRGGCRLNDVALQGAPFKFSPRLDFEMAILEDVLDQLTLGSNCRDANLKKNVQ